MKKNEEGFGKHNDEQHNLIVASEGVMQYKVWDKNDNLIIDEEVTNGDAVFVPAGTDHQVIPKTKRISLSFPTVPYDQNRWQEREWLKIEDILND